MMCMSCERVLTGLKESGTDCSYVSSSMTGLSLQHYQKWEDVSGGVGDI